jgi:phosphatidylserine synthase
MRPDSKIALTLTTSLLFAKPAFAVAGKDFLPQNPGEYAIFILICLMLLLMLMLLSMIFVDLWLAIRGYYCRRRIIKELNERYDVLSTDEKEMV